MPHLPHTVLVLLLFCVSCLATLPQLTVSRGKITTSNTHTPFIPRGANYIRLNASQGGASPTDPTHPVYHSTFSPRLFNATQAQARLAQLHAQGYNIVWVFCRPRRSNTPRRCGAGQVSFTSVHGQRGHVCTFGVTFPHVHHSYPGTVSFVCATVQLQRLCLGPTTLSLPQCCPLCRRLRPCQTTILH